MDVFFGDGDRAAYLDLLQELSAQHGLHILGYCLMSNHVHLIALHQKEGHKKRDRLFISVDTPRWGALSSERCRDSPEWWCPVIRIT